MELKECKSKDDLINHYLIRKIVFIDEQNVSYEDEFDLEEKTKIPFIVISNNIPIAAARLNIVEDIAKIERVCVLKEYRQQGVGTFIMNSLENIARENNISILKISSQTQALNFYESLGYQKYGTEFLDANIPHYNMKKILEN